MIDYSLGLFFLLIVPDRGQRMRYSWGKTGMTEIFRGIT